MGLCIFAINKVLSQSPQNTGIPKSRAIFIGEFYDQPVACSRGSHFLKKFIWVTTNWPAGPQRNRRVQVWIKFLRNNDFNHLRSIWKSQTDLELISRGNIFRQRKTGVPTVDTEMVSESIFATKARQEKCVTDWGSYCQSTYGGHTCPITCNDNETLGAKDLGLWDKPPDLVMRDVIGNGGSYCTAPLARAIWPF